MCVVALKAYCYLWKVYYYYEKVLLRICRIPFKSALLAKKCEMV